MAPLITRFSLVHKKSRTGEFESALNKLPACYMFSMVLKIAGVGDVTMTRWAREVTVDFQRERCGSERV